MIGGLLFSELNTTPSKIKLNKTLKINYKLMPPYKVLKIYKFKNYSNALKIQLTSQFKNKDNF